MRKMRRWKVACGVSFCVVVSDFGNLPYAPNVINNMFTVFIFSSFLFFSLFPMVCECVVKSKMKGVCMNNICLRKFVCFGFWIM